MKRIALAVITTLSFVLAVGACDPESLPDEDDGDGTTSSGTTTPADDVASGRWFGKISIRSDLLQVSHDDLGGMGTHDTNGRTHIETTILVDETGARTVAANGRFDFFQVDDLHPAPCYDQYATSSTHAAGKLSEGPSHAYFSLVADGADGFRLQESPKSVQISASADTHNVVRTSTCDLTIIQRSDNPGPQPLVTLLPLDKIVGKLDPDKRGASGTLKTKSSDYEHVIRWRFKRDKEVVAVANAADVVRAATATLDGSASRGEIDSYVWSVEPNWDCELGSLSVPMGMGPHGPFGQPVVAEKETFELVALCGVDATLTVSGPKGTDEDFTQLTVTPRPWTMSPPLSSPTQADLNTKFGTNVCAEEGVGVESGHMIHTSKGNTWEGDGYTLGEVDDPSGPFHGVSYVTASTLLVSRLEVANSSWLPNGWEYNFNAVEKNNAANVILLGKQIRAHEKAHSTLVTKWLADQGNDPAPKIELLISPDPEQLVNATDTVVRGANTEMCIATGHDAVNGLLQTEFDVPITYWLSAFPDNAIDVPALYALASDNPCNL